MMYKNSSEDAALCAH